MSITVTVCRDCCCGTTRKHPEADHDGQLRTLREGIGEVGRVVVSECLLACERSNVMVVAPAPADRDAGVRPVWLSEVLTAEQTTAVVAWVSAGGPGRVAVPALLVPLVAERPRPFPSGAEPTG